MSLSLVVAAAASAVTIVPGDLALIPFNNSLGSDFLPPSPMYLIDSDGAFVGSLTNWWPLVAFGPDSHLLLGSYSQVTEYDSSLRQVRSIPTAKDLIGFLVAPNGDLGALDYQYVLYVLGASGQLKASFNLPHTGSQDFPPAFDLAPDGCTLLYTDGAHSGRRFNVCNGTALANLAGGPTDMVRALQNGGYVAVHNATLDFYDVADHLVRSIDTPFTFGPISGVHPASPISTSTAIRDSSGSPRVTRLTRSGSPMAR
jgi:hypothetical protein